MSDYPLDWHRVKIGDLLIEHSERSSTSSQHEVLSVTRDGIFSQRAYFKKQIASEDNSGYKVVKNGDVVFSAMNLWMGSIDVVKDHQVGIVSPAYITMRPNKQVVDIDFLSYFLRGDDMRKKYVQHSQQGASIVRRNLNKDDLLDDEIAIPPLPEQKKIAEILSGITSAIAKLKCKARKLDSLQFSLTEEFAQELNDKGEPSALEENAEIRTGVAKNSNNEGDMVEMPYMRVANVQDGYLDLSEIKTISIDRGRIKRYLLQKGDVLINEGGDLDKVGRGAIWHEEIKECLHQNHVFAVRCSERLMPEFLSLYLKSSASKNYFLGCAKQTTNLASINSAQLKSFPIPVPELSIQKKFVERITSTKDLSFAIATEISGLGAIKKAISGDLLSGRKRVSI